jgi:uncharacterized membrane protein
MLPLTEQLHRATLMRDKIWFDSRITPHLSLGRKGRILVSLALLFPATVLGIFLTVFHAWPASFFVGGESLWAIFALNWCAKRLSEKGERVLLTDRDLIIERWDRGASHSRRLEPAWVSLERQDHEEFGCEAVFLRVSGRRWRIASMLGAEARAAFADGLRQALELRQRNFRN